MNTLSHTLPDIEYNFFFITFEIHHLKKSIQIRQYINKSTIPKSEHPHQKQPSLMQIEFPYRTRKKTDPNHSEHKTDRIRFGPPFVRFSPATLFDVLGALDARLSAAI